MNDAPIRAELTLPLGDNAAAVESALLPEVDRGPVDRAQTTVSRNGGELRLEFRALDVVALRAAVNTWLRLTQVADRILRYGQE